MGRYSEYIAVIPKPGAAYKNYKSGPCATINDAVIECQRIMREKGITAPNFGYVYIGRSCIKKVFPEAQHAEA